MKKGRTWVYVTVVAVVVAAFLILYYIFGNDDTKYSWFQSYRVDSEQPYGTKFLKEMLQSWHPDAKFTLNEKKQIRDILKADMKNTSYVLVGQGLFLDYEDTEAVMNFIKNGNDVFIASNEVPTTLTARLFDEECEVMFSLSSSYVVPITANFYHDKLRTRKGYEYRIRFRDEDVKNEWGYVDYRTFCEQTRSFIPLGHFAEDKVNFLEFRHGDGSLFIHTNPIMFTNYFLTKEGKVEYAEKVFSHLDGKDIIMDEFSKLPYLSKGKNPYDSPLYYIMQQPSLKYAWWLLILAVILYVIFAAKRMQRVIPVLEQKSNTSLEFLTMISSLHFQNGNHLDMARKKMKYFLYFIRAKYGINTQSLTEEQVKKLAERSKVRLADVQHIYDRYKVIENYAVDNIQPQRLVDLYRAIDQFYKTCK